MNTSGVMVTGTQEIEGVTYNFNTSGALVGEVKPEPAKNGWVSENGTWYYYADGAKQTGWLYSGAWYYLDANGAMVTGWVYVGAWYYMGSNGAMATGWLYDSGYWYYLTGSGAMAANTTLNIGGVNYTFNGSGVWIG